MKKIIVLLSLLKSINLFACQTVSAPANLNYAIDPANKTAYYYNETRMIWDRPDINFENCLKTAAADKYIMIAVALENFVLSDDFLTYSINDRITSVGEQCKIVNNKFSNVQESSDRRERLNTKRRFVNSCLVFDLTDFSESGIDVKDNQPGCKITRVSKNAVNFEGPFCFIKPKPDSAIALGVSVKPECLNNEIYKERELILQDVLGVLSFYTAGDDSGFSSDLTSLKQVNFRISTNAPTSLIPTNVENGDAKPTWPTQWFASDVYLGKPSIITSKTLTDELKFPLLVDNRCERVCKDNVCTSSCDYSQPVVGEFSLSTLNKKGKKEILASWFDGGIAPAQWQGLLGGVGVSLKKNLLEFNKRYFLEVELADQELNYLSLKGRIEKQIRMNNNIGAMNHGGTAIREIPMINTIEELNNLPTIRDIVGIYFSGNGFTGVQEALKSIELTFKNSFWPPFYDDVCNKDGRCIKQSNAKNYLTLEFDLVGSLEKPEFRNVKFSRNSNIVSVKPLQAYDFPRIDCGFDDTTDSTDVPDFDLDF